MKLIRTLIESQRSGDKAPVLRPSQIAEKPLSQLSQPRPASLRARTILSQRLDARVQDFKLDLAALAPRSTSPSDASKPKRVWDMDTEVLPTQDAAPEEQETHAAEDDGLQTQPVQEEDAPTTEGVSSDMRPERKASALRMLDIPEPLQPRRALTAGRTRTRIMGFGDTASAGDMFAPTDDGEALGLEFPVGWLVITKGPGRGKSFVLQNVVSSIGRAQDQTISLNFGDDTISRNNHAAVAYDDQMNACFLGFGGKANLVRLNGRPVLATEQLSHGDTIRVGETDLRFIALCGTEFSWNEDGDASDG